MAKDVAHLGIRVTIVEPGPLRTKLDGHRSELDAWERLTVNTGVGAG